MKTEDKYYYKTRSAWFSKKDPPCLIRLSPHFWIEVAESVEWNQVIFFSALKLGQKNASLKGDKDTYLSPVLKETFLDHYNLALKYIHETVLDDGEFYLLKYSRDSYKVQYFSKDEHHKQGINIAFADGIEEFCLSIDHDHRHKYRPRYRRDASAITYEQFRQFLNLTVQFLHDTDSTVTLMNDYIKSFKLLGKGDTKIAPLIFSTSKSFEEILNQLELRKEYIEKRLIENDNDSTIDRAKFRGELEGVNFAVKVINMNK